MEKISYGGWPNCVRLANREIELIATTDIGPRIIRFGFIGGENEFFEHPEQLGKIGGDEWRIYGGHRLWLSPEVKPRSYHPDNTPVQAQADGNTLRLTAETESTTGMQKQIELTLDPDANHVHLVHKISNRTCWTVEMAPWALSVMNAGGCAIIPQEPYAPHPDAPDFPGQKVDAKYYHPVRNLALWAYTRLDDPRWIFTANYTILKQDKTAAAPQKMGFSGEQGWAAYARGGHLFVKTIAYRSDAIYPDGGSAFEAFTNSDMLELETLGPLTQIEPGATISHTEDWHLFDDVEFDCDDESITAKALPKVKPLL